MRLKKPALHICGASIKYFKNGQKHDLSAAQNANLAARTSVSAEDQSLRVLHERVYKNVLKMTKYRLSEKINVVLSFYGDIVAIIWHALSKRKLAFAL